MDANNGQCPVIPNWAIDARPCVCSITISEIVRFLRADAPFQTSGAGPNTDEPTGTQVNAIVLMNRHTRRLERARINVTPRWYRQWLSRVSGGLVSLPGIIGKAHRDQSRSRQPANLRGSRAPPGLEPGTASRGWRCRGVPGLAPALSRTGRGQRFAACVPPGCSPAQGGTVRCSVAAQFTIRTTVTTVTTGNPRAR